MFWGGGASGAGGPFPVTLPKASGVPRDTTTVPASCFLPEYQLREALQWGSRAPARAWQGGLLRKLKSGVLRGSGTIPWEHCGCPNPWRAPLALGTGASTSGCAQATLHGKCRVTSASGAPQRARAASSAAPVFPPSQCS